MKPGILLVMVMAVGCILAAGCVGMTNKNTINASTTASFAPFSNSSDSGLTTTITTTANNSSNMKGSLRVSIGGISYPANLSVLLDNETVGMVKPAVPLYLMVSEGNHTVKICVKSVCKQETVTTRFGSYATVDFSEWLTKEVEFPNPTARPTAHILDYYMNGNVISVYVELINPETVDHMISVDLSVGYTSIEDRSHVKHGDSARARIDQFVKAEQKETKRVEIYLTKGDSVISFGNPVIEDLKVK